jgi:hypothetical protein
MKVKSCTVNPTLVGIFIYRYDEHKQLNLSKPQYLFNSMSPWEFRFMKIENRFYIAGYNPHPPKEVH